MYSFLDWIICYIQTTFTRGCLASDNVKPQLDIHCSTVARAIAAVHPYIYSYIYCILTSRLLSHALIYETLSKTYDCLFAVRSRGYRVWWRVHLSDKTALFYPTGSDSSRYNLLFFVWCLWVLSSRMSLNYSAICFGPWAFSSLNSMICWSHSQYYMLMISNVYLRFLNHLNHSFFFLN